MNARTFWHLKDRHRKPSDYEITSSRLLYYRARGLAVETPAGSWILERQRQCPLKLESSAVEDWEDFFDPNEMTYAKYVAAQQEKEIYVDGLLRSIEKNGYDANLDPAWLEVLGDILGAVRYPIHGLQMVSCFVGQAAPYGRIAIASALQAADEIRKAERLTYRMVQLRRTRPGFGDDARTRWQLHERWQPLRRVIEELLVTYDWGEALVALGVVVKPMLDGFMLGYFADLAEERGDPILGKLLRSLGEDSFRNQQWVDAFVRLCLGLSPENAPILHGFIEKWERRVSRALEPLTDVFAERRADVLAALRELPRECERAMGVP